MNSPYLCYVIFIIHFFTINGYGKEEPKELYVLMKVTVESSPRVYVMSLNDHDLKFSDIEVRDFTSEKVYKEILTNLKKSKKIKSSVLNNDNIRAQFTKLLDENLGLNEFETFIFDKKNDNIKHQYLSIILKYEDNTYSMAGWNKVVANKVERVLNIIKANKKAAVP